jgi:uncharacterized membrane protein YbaN (DUF454 family)
VISDITWSEFGLLFVSLILILAGWVFQKYDDGHADKILNTTYYYKVQNRFTKAFARVSKNRSFGFLLIAWSVLAIIILLVPKGERFSQIASEAISILVALLIAYLSVDYLLKYIRQGERMRINSNADIIEHYEGSDGEVDLSKEFIDMSDLPQWNGEELGYPNNGSGKFPAVVEDKPSYAKTVGDIDINFRNEMYEIGEDISGIIEPEEDLFLREFKRGDNFSGLNFRVREMRDESIVGEKTTYYRSFKTNFCPDLEFNNGSKTLRKLTDGILFGEDGKLKSIDESPLSDHLGIACICITTDGRTRLVIRSPEVAIDQLSLSLPVSGSANLLRRKSKQDLELEDFIYEEIEEEITDDETSIEDVREDVVSLIYLGTVRRMERLGKPDLFSVAVLDEDFEFSIGTNEYIGVIGDGEGDDNLNLDMDIHTPEDILTRDNVDKITNEYIEAISDEERPPSIGLASCVYLLNQVTDEIE